MMNKLVILALVFVGTIMLVQQNATNQTNQTSGYNYSAQAKPDGSKFCAEFNNDDGTTGESCEYKSKGECKKGSIAQSSDDFRECKKRD